MKIKYIKIDKQKLDNLKKECSDWKKDYLKKYDEYNLLEKEFVVDQSGKNNLIESLNSEIRDLKLILAGVVCKDNPFVNKKDTEMQFIPKHDNFHKIITY